MKQLTAEQRQELVGEYFAPQGYYDYVKSLPFLGSVTSNVQNATLIAGQWTEIVITYTVGASGLADGAWIKGTFKFYSVSCTESANVMTSQLILKQDWALFQTSDRTKDNHVSAEYVPRQLLPGQTPATVQNLRLRFDQKGHERPFQKAIIIDIVDGYLNPGDQIVIRLGDRRFGAKGTRAQTFVESNFKWRFYIDPIGTSRFAPIVPDIVWDIVPGPPHRLVVLSPRLVRLKEFFSIHCHSEDIWGNVNRDIEGLTIHFEIIRDHDKWLTAEGNARPQGRGWINEFWENNIISKPAAHTIHANLIVDATGETILSASSPLTIADSLPMPKLLYGDLHVHSDDTVGTQDSTYNFTYGRDIAALDVLGYTANDFQITKARWESTLQLIASMNKPGSFVIFPGTEWCGNSAAGGDHNVVFLADPATRPPEFPFDRHGNVARSFEWSEDGPEDLVPGAWPLDELYATYAAESETHLLIPHVGGRRCDLAWHHPRLERLVEIGSAWGHFEWLLRDAVKRGWKLGVSANSDEHRGRCGGGVPGTAVFGVRGGLTGILANSLDRVSVAAALRARHTFATTGSRLAVLMTTVDGHMQGDDIEAESSKSLQIHCSFYGINGFCSLEAWDASGCFWKRDLWQEKKKPSNTIRITWGGARLYDRYREAVWEGSIRFPLNVTVEKIKTFGGFSYNSEDEVEMIDSHTLRFSSRTSGDTDGVHISFVDGKIPHLISIIGTLGGYVKVGDPLSGNPHRPQPTFSFGAKLKEMETPGGRTFNIAGGAELFVAAQAIPDDQLPIEVNDTIEISGSEAEMRAVYLVGREWSGDKVVSSPLFVRFK